MRTLKDPSLSGWGEGYRAGTSTPGKASVLTPTAPAVLNQPQGSIKSNADTAAAIRHSVNTNILGDIFLNILAPLLVSFELAFISSQPLRHFLPCLLQHTGRPCRCIALRLRFYYLVYNFTAALGPAGG